jgi:hypothetical protein
VSIVTPHLTPAERWHLEQKRSLRRLLRAADKQDRRLQTVKQ